MTNFSKFAWQLYQKSSEGKATIDYSLEELVENIFNVPAGEFFHAVFRERKPVHLKATERIGLDGLAVLEREIATWIRGVPTANKIRLAFEDVVDNGFSFWDYGIGAEPDLELAFNQGKKPDFKSVCTGIHWISAGFHLAFPDQFAPFFFGRKFDLFSMVCRRYGIPIPDLPRKLRNRERATYYLAVNDELQKFRKEARLSPNEFNAFLYDYAIKDCEQDQPAKAEIPPPTRIWFVIGGTGGPWDHEYVEQVDENSTSIWQGNIDTRPGDIVVMYMASPKKAIHSIWRATSYGFIDPFFYYYSAMRVASPIKIPPIPFSEIAAHPVFKGTPAIRARFQGRSGSELRIEEYNAICEMAKKKGFDVSQLPAAPEPIKLPNVEIQNERDVEEKLLEPLLAKLGFDEEDWERQVSLKVGRKDRVIPDYALLPSRSGKNISAKAMIEAKHNVVSEKDRNDASDQARSYAKLLGVSRMGIVAKQGIWIYMTGDGNFDRARGEAFDWSDIEQPERFARLVDLIGKDSLLRM